MQIKSKSITRIQNNLMSIFIICTLLTNTPTFLNSKFIKVISFSVLLLLLLYNFIIKNKSVSRDIIFVILASFPLLFQCLLYFSIYSNSYYFQFIYNIILSLLMILIGGCIDYEYINFSYILKAYLLGTFVIAIDVYFKFLHGILFNTGGYVYQLKNSVGVMFSISIILLIFFYKNINRIMKYILISFYLVMIIGLMNRSSMVALSISIFISFFLSSNLKGKFKTIYVLFILLVVLFSIPSIRIVILDALRLDVLEQGIEEFSSGRISLIYKGIDTFLKNPILGKNVTDFYVECFWVQIMASLGLIGLYTMILFFGVLLFKLYEKIRIIKTQSFFKGGVCLSVYVFIISFLEQQAPFGPGAVYFIFWIIIGYFLRIKPNES